MAQEDESRALTSLFGTWESIEAFGNTSLDWSQAVKEQRVQVRLMFKAGQTYKFCLVSKTDATDVTSTFRHVIATEGSYELREKDGIIISGDKSGIKWTFLLEEEDSLRIRYEQ